MQTVRQAKPSETELAVADYLAKLWVKIDIHHCGLQTEDGWQHDAWHVTLRRATKTLVTPYRTGIGHRAVIKGPWGAKSNIPVYPTAASIVYCMLSDYTDGCSFSEWCAEFGYDTDSRKALGTYLACGEQTTQLNNLFSKAEQAHLNALLEDY